MKNIITLAIITFLTSSSLFGQTYLDSTINSSTKKILLGDKGFSIGSYGEAHYNAPIEKGKFRNGTADLHRVILFLGYKFNKKLQFFTEIEFEHIKEVYVEQAFVDYSFNSAVNLKAGVILIPMGYVNEFHEPTLFNGVERPAVDKYIIPTTWREIGLGLHGLIKKANLKYQVYAVNGFNGYDNGANISGSNGVRSGRQKGAKAVLRTPAVTGKLTFFGFNGLRLGLSGYYGFSESNLYNGISRDDETAVATADSTRLEIGMIALNLQYNIAGFQFMMEGNYTSLGNSGEYNEYVVNNHPGSTSNVAKEIMGFYTELSYRWKLKKEKDFPQLIPFVRYENYDTHMTVGRGMTEDDGYNREVLTAGVGFQLLPGIIFKSDYQWLKTVANPSPTGMFNLGFGYWF